MNRTRRATLAGLLVALVVAAGFSLAGVPNVELVTLLIFVSGFLLGRLPGAVVGAVAWALFSMFNPMGAAVPPILAAQIIAGATIGFTGGLLGPALMAIPGRAAGMILCGLTGIVLTAVFEVLLNAAAFVVFADDRTFWAFVAGAAVFSLTHLIWNTAVFFLTLRPLMKVLNRYRLELR